MNWVGYRLTGYLALPHFFIEHARPVPSFIVLDQPSQAFFPRARDLRATCFRRRARRSTPEAATTSSTEPAR